MPLLGDTGGGATEGSGSLAALGREAVEAAEAGVERARAGDGDVAWDGREVGAGDDFDVASEDDAASAAAGSDGLTACCGAADAANTAAGDDDPTAASGFALVGDSVMASDGDVSTSDEVALSAPSARRPLSAATLAYPSPSATTPATARAADERDFREEIRSEARAAGSVGSSRSAWRIDTASAKRSSGSKARARSTASAKAFGAPGSKLRSGGAFAVIA